MEDFTGKLSRRKFVGNLSALLALTGSGLLSTEILEAKQLRKLTILHTNDTHSRIDPFPDNDPRYAGMGGITMRAALIEEIRRQEKNVLLFDSGDIFQGTPYYNLYGGRPELECMTAMRYDAATMGNHDFDSGLEGFNKVLPFAKFPFLCANYDFSNTLLHNKTIPWKIFECEEIRVGVFGIGIELSGLVDKKLYGETLYQDAIKTALKISSQLKNELKCNYVVCLSHLGYRYENTSKVSDTLLAHASTDIDLILGGHTHTFLDEPVKTPNAKYKEILIAQTGFAGIRLGRIDIYFNEKSKNIFTKGTHAKISKKTR